MQPSVGVDPRVMSSAAAAGSGAIRDGGRRWEARRGARGELTGTAGDAPRNRDSCLRRQVVGRVHDRKHGAAEKRR